MKIQKLLVLSGISLAILNSCIVKKKADLIITNAVIYTIDAGFSTANSMVIHDGNIIAVGDYQHISKKYKADTTTDLNGACVYPGFIDAHSHFTGYAKTLREVDLSGATSFDEVVSLLKKWQENQHSKWIVGFGWDQNRWAVKKFPDNTMLDKEFPGVAIILSRIDGHAVLASSEAIRQAHLPKDIPQGQAILSDGKYSGIFLENTADKLKAAIPDPSDDEMADIFVKAQQNCFNVGLTSVCDAGLVKDEILRIEKLQENGSLKIRVYAMLTPDEATLKYFLPKGVYVSDRLTVRSIKMYADGALGSRGACLLHPYSDDPKNYGMIVTPGEEFRKNARKALDYGFQLNTHCIGDSANRMVLNIYGEFLKKKNDLRWRIEHAQVVDPNDFQLFGKYSVIPSIQSTHATSDMIWAKDRLGDQRVKSAYAYKQLLEENGWIPNGTDFPVEKINPLNTFYAAVFRKNRDGYPNGGWQMENALSRQDALCSITLWAAKANFEEKQKGSLEKGKVADFVVLDTDLMKAPEKDILKAKVLATYINGRKVSQ